MNFFSYTHFYRLFNDNAICGHVIHRKCVKVFTQQFPAFFFQVKSLFYVFPYTTTEAGHRRFSSVFFSTKFVRVAKVYWNVTIKLRLSTCHEQNIIMSIYVRSRGKSLCLTTAV